MKKLYFLDEGEKNRILNLYESANKRRYLNEAADTPELKIAQQIVNATSKVSGTDPAGLIKAIQSIADATQFWKVNELVKTLNGDKLDIVGLINDEFEYGVIGSNRKDLDEITTKLKTFGFRPTIQQDSGRYIKGTYKINAQPTSTSTNSGLSAEATACIKQFGTPKPAASPPGFVYVDLEDDSTLFFGVDNSTQYKPKDKPTIYGKWSCNSNVLNIVLDDGDSWSKAQGWKGTQPNKAAVVDPKVAYQQRAKQVIQQTQTTTKQIQQSLGVETPSGVLDSAEVETMINKLKQ
jgi:hypothetical protein